MGDKTISAGYAKLLELFTHEYFHAWWVKRVKPSVFIPYDLTHETYTNLLWVFEGFTSYYDALLTARSGATDTESYLKSLSETLNRHYLASAKNRQSLAESSFDAWIKYYKVRTNRSRSVTSYYDKGALVAMALDAFIRKESAGKHSLDDVLRYAWQQFKEVGKDYAGIDEEMMPELIFEATGIDVSEKIDRWVYGCEEPDYKRVLKTMGIDLTEEKLPIERDVLQATLSGTNVLKVSQLDEAGAAELAGLCVGDELLAIDSIRVTKSNLEKLLNRYRQAKTFSLHVFRNGLLKEFFLKPRKADVRKIKLSVNSGGRAFCRWLNR
ncbi:peptidase M61 [Sutterella sp. CAG:521]|nr:peptidase M61 [Sutterella sp. CAG:521]